MRPAYIELPRRFTECQADYCGQTVQENTRLDTISVPRWNACLQMKAESGMPRVHSSALSDQKSLQYVLFGLLDITLSGPLHSSLQHAVRAVLLTISNILFYLRASQRD